MNIQNIKSLNIDNPSLISVAKNEIEKNGVVKIDNFINKQQCKEIKKLLEGSQLRNSNQLTFVHLDDAKFFSNALAESKAAYDLVTSKFSIKISKSYLGEKIRLKCHRAYSTKKNYFFPWHTDNKFDDIKNNRKGIVFIIYLVDTFYGATEFILGSHKESAIYKKNNFENEFINKKYKNNIVKATGQAGCAIISDTRTIHRGSYEKKADVDRYSFWFQVDSDSNEAERLLLNPEFLPQKISDELSKYLGFSKSFGLDVHPVTTNIDKVLPFKLRIWLFFKFFILSILIPIHWLRIKTPIKFKNFLKFLLGKKNDYN